MIYGIGCDIVQVSRLKKMIEKQGFVNRFFNIEEQIENSNGSLQHMAEHYAARFAAKEAFSKALGTGIVGFELKDVFVTKMPSGQPLLNVTGSALELLNQRCGNDCNVLLSLSHEKEYALAYVIIESKNDSN